jgi:hypothetical protein
VQLLDHLVIGRFGFYSFTEHGDVFPESAPRPPTVTMDKRTTP